MPDVQDPAQTAETVTQVNGSLAEGNTATPTVEPEVTQPDPSTAEIDKIKAELEAIKVAKNQAEMRANQLENERKAAEKAKAEEEGRYKELYEQAEAERQGREARELRNSVIDSYENEKVRAAAKKLLAVDDSEFWWNDTVESPEDAKAQVKAKLDVIAETFAPEPTPVVEPEVDAPSIDANNPPTTMGVAPDEELKALKDRLANVVF